MLYNSIRYNITVMSNKNIIIVKYNLHIPLFLHKRNYYACVVWTVTLFPL